MRLRSALLGILVLAGTLITGAATAAPAPPGALGGSGPHSAGYETTLRLTNHTIYRPNTLPGGSGSTDSGMLTDSIDWAVAENSRRTSKYHGRIDTTKVAVMGQSCGGIETYEVADDPRITTTVLWNSGLLDDAQNGLLQRLRAPIAYCIGGPSDIAHANAMDDWRRLPAFMGNLDVGHFGTFSEPNGGEFGRVGGHWLKWQLKGDPTSRAQFVGTNCGLCASDWDVLRKDL